LGIVSDGSSLLVVDSGNGRIQAITAP